jgi:hypothetical protein
MNFRTLNFACLNKYHDLFYKNKTKVVPLNIHELLTPRGLAHWIMGDGFFILKLKTGCYCFMYRKFHKKWARSFNSCFR